MDGAANSKEALAILAEARAALVARGQARPLPATGGAAALAALRSEIGETILPRKLVVRGGATPLTLWAAGRRLYGAAAGADAAAPAPKPSAKDIAALLAQFAQSAEALQVESQPAATALGAAPSALALDKLWPAAEAALAALPPASARPLAPAAAPPAEAALPPQDGVATDEAAKPHAAVKALIREKIASARKTTAEGPGPTKTAVAPKLDDAPLRQAFAALAPQVDLCLLLNRDGNAEAIGGRAPDEAFLPLAAHLCPVLAEWLARSEALLGAPQLVVLRAGGIQNRSLALFVAPYGLTFALFANTDLPRLFQLAAALVPKAAAP